jgi:CRISPR-associated protein Csc1
MKLFPISVKLLSPLFNYCKVTNGGAITSDFIGDIALTYALNRVRKDKNFYQEFRKKPNYAELRDLDYFFTVARPVNMKMTGLYTRNTLFNVDGGPDYGILNVVGSNLFKNYFKVQGVSIESQFSSILLCKDGFRPSLPFTVRLGTGRECLALIERDETFNDRKDDVWLNVFSLKTIFGDSAVKSTVRIVKTYHFDYKLENYILLKRVQLSQVKDIFSEFYDSSSND